MSVLISNRLDLSSLPYSSKLSTVLKAPLKILGCELYILDGYEQFEQVERGGFPLFGGFTSEHTTSQEGFTVLAKKDGKIVGTWAAGYWPQQCRLIELMDETSVFHKQSSGERWAFQGTALQFAKAMRGPFVKVGGFYLAKEVRSTEVSAGLTWFMQALGRTVAQELYQPRGIFGFYIDEHVKRGIADKFRLTHLAEYVQRIQFTTGPVPYWLGICEEVDVFRRAEELIECTPAGPYVDKEEHGPDSVAIDPTREPAHLVPLDRDRPRVIV
ncbi:MAG: hypothetical protein NXI16_05625 [Alphaproteobacteria bacterium]|nr:hypothetical protein [Alphaproteobacteria bacterium]